MLKIREGYLLRNILDEYIVVTTGAVPFRPYRIMSTNETGAFLWNILIDGAVESDLLDKMLESYEVDADTAKRDIGVFLDQLRKWEVLEEC